MLWVNAQLAKQVDLPDAEELEESSQAFFIATTGPQKADSYSGPRLGYKYQNGPQGIGYYLDDPKTAAKHNYILA